MYVIISYLFSAFFLARLAFLIEALSFDFTAFYEFLSNLKFNEIFSFLSNWQITNLDDIRGSSESSMN